MSPLKWICPGRLCKAETSWAGPTLPPFMTFCCRVLTEVCQSLACLPIVKFESKKDGTLKSLKVRMLPFRYRESLRCLLCAREERQLLNPIPTSSKKFNLKMLCKGIVTGGPTFLKAAGLLWCTGRRLILKSLCQAIEFLRDPPRSWGRIRKH